MRLLEHSRGKGFAAQKRCGTGQNWQAGTSGADGGGHPDAPRQGWRGVGKAGGQAASKTITITQIINATGITTDELTARIAAEAKKAVEAANAADADAT